MSKYSLNNRVVVEAYKTDKSLRASVSNGFATVAQKTGLIGLKILMDAMLKDYGSVGINLDGASSVSPIVIRAGSTAYIREEILHNAPWAKAALSCDTIDVPFMVVDLSQIEFIDPPTDGDAA